MKIAVHMYFEERQHYCPAMSEFKRLQNALNSIGGTAVHADRTKCRKQKQLRRVTVQRASLFSRRAKQKPKNESAGYTVASHQTVPHFTTSCENVNSTTHATAFKLITINYNRSNFTRRHDCQFAHPDWRIICKKKKFLRWPRSGASYCLKLQLLMALSSKCVIRHKWYTCLERNLSSAISLGKVTEKGVLHLSENSCLKSVVCFL